MKNIVISCDENYILPARVFLRSMAEMNRDIRIWFIYSRVGEASIEALRTDIEKYGWEFRPVKLDEAEEEAFDGFPVDLYLTKECYYRLLMPWLLKEEDKALYMDVDIMIRGSIEPIYNADLSQNFIAAVLDCWPGARRDAVKRLELSSDYVNSGVVMMNLKAIREQWTQDAFVAEIQKIQKTYQLKYMDQDVINKIYDGKILKLDERYNYAAARYVVERLVFKYNLRKTVVVAHFLAGRKPWNKNYFGYYGREYRRYLKEFQK